MLNPHTDPLTAALDLIASGVPVFPCDPTVLPDGKIDKSPLIAGGFHKATLDPDQVRAWAVQFPGCLWGVPTGRRTGLAVFDVDVDRSKGLDGFASVREAGLNVPKTRAHATPRGGMQLLYKLGPDQTCPSDVAKLGPGLDRRGDGGYIIWWPAHGYTVVESMAPIAAPTWLTTPVRTGKDAIRPITAEQAADLLSEFVERAAGAGDGERNATLHASAFQCGQLVEAGFVELEVARDALLAAASEYPEESKTRRDALEVITGGLRRGMDARGYEDISSAVFRAFGSSPYKSRGLLIDGLDVLNQPTAPRWLIRDVMEDGVNSLLYGPSNAGKSFIVMDWCLSIACGVDWCGHAVKQGPVVYIACEGVAGVRRRVMAWVTGRGVRYAAGMFRMTEKPVALNDEATLQSLFAEIDTGPKPVLVVVDTKNRATPGWDENAPVDTGRYVALTDRIMARYGCGSLTVHHEAKTSKGSAGHYSLKGAMDNEWSVTGVGEGPPFKKTSLAVTKLRDGEPMKPKRFTFVDVMIPWFDDRGVQLRSAVLELDQAGEGEAVAGGGRVSDVVKRLTVNDRLLLQACGFVDEATVTDTPLDYGEVRAAFIQLHGASDKRDKGKAFNSAIGRAEERGCFELRGSTLLPAVWAVKRDLKA